MASTQVQVSQIQVISITKTNVWIQELHYLENLLKTVSTWESTSCSGLNTGNSDAIHSLYSKNDLHLLIAFLLPRRGWGGGGVGGVLQQPVLFTANFLECIRHLEWAEVPTMEAWRPKEESSFDQSVCVCVLGVQICQPCVKLGEVRDGKMKEHT